MQVQTSPAEERGETWRLRREKGTLASISLTLRLTFNHEGETHTHRRAHTHRHTRTHRLGPGSSGKARKREVRENRKVEEKWDPSLPSFFFLFSLQVKKRRWNKSKKKMYFVQLESDDKSQTSVQYIVNLIVKYWPRLHLF